MRVRRPAATLLACLAACTGGCRGGNLTFERIEYVNAERPENPNTVSVAGDGSAVLDAYFSGAAQTQGQIGTFQGRLSQGLIDQLERLAGDAALAGAPDDTGRILAGSSHRIIRVHRGSATIEKALAWDAQPHPLLQQLISVLESCATELKAHPQRVLEVQLRDVSVDAGGVIGGTMVMRNRGAEKVRARNPLASVDATGTWLQVEAWPDRADVRADQVVRAPVNHITKDGATPEQPSVDLAKGESQSYSFRAAPKWTVHGAHQMRIVFDNSLDPGAQPAEPAGDIYTPVVKVSVP